MNPVQIAELKTLFTRSFLIVIAAVAFSAGCLAVVTDIPGLIGLTVLCSLLVTESSAQAPGFIHGV